MRNIVIHTGSLKNYYYYKNRIFDFVRDERDGYLAILPVNRAVRIFKKMLIDTSPGQALIDPPVYTFDELLLKIYQKLPHAKRIINNDVLLFLIEELLHRNAGRFKFLPAKKNIPPGLIKKTADIITELRRFGYSGKQFSGIDISKKSDNPLKYQDFELILTKLEEYAGNKLIDEPFAQHTAADQLTEQLFRKFFPKAEEIYISGYGLFTPAMFLFIEKTSKWCKVEIKLEYHPSNPALFKHTAPAIQRFKEMNAQIIEEKRPRPIAHYLFNRHLSPESRPDLSDRVEVQPLKDRDDEVSFIAARIRELHLKSKIPFKQIAVTFSNMERYVPLIRRLFDDYGIPFNLSTGYGLNQSPLIRSFLNTLRLIESGFEFQKTLHFFNSSFIKKPRNYNPALLHELLVENRMKYLSNGWAERLKARIKDKEDNNASLNNEEVQPEILDKCYQIENLNNLLKFFYQIPKTASVQEFRVIYINLLKNIGMLDWYNSENPYSNDQQRENEFRAFNRFMKLFDKLIWTLAYLHGYEKIPLQVFSKHLQTTVERSVYNLTEWQDYGVQIMPRLEIQALDFEVLFIGGLIDGEFPRASTKDVFFNDRVRAKMGLVAAEELLDQDRFIFYTLLDSQANKLFLTYPKYEEDRVLVPSTFISDINDTAKIDLKTELPDDKYLLNIKRVWRQAGYDIQEHRFTEAAEQIQNIRQTDKENKHNTTEKLSTLLERVSTDRQRIVADGFSIFEGNLKSIPAIKELLKKRFSNRTWSISMLEDYAFCPMHFYLNRILKIDELPKLEEELSSLERGSAVHKILFQFYTALKKNGQSAQPAMHRDLLFRIADTVLEQLPYDGFFWQLERNKYFGSSDRIGLLDAFLEYDQKLINETGYIPIYFEYGFGFTGNTEKDEASQNKELVLEKKGLHLKLNGKIDRIDVNPQGNCLIFDYKTGSPDSSIKAKNMAKGISFQLPLYLLALKELCQELHPVYGGYYQVKDADNCERHDVIADSEQVTFVSRNSDAWLPNKKVLNEDGDELSLNDLLDLSLSHACEKVEELKSGQFRHTIYPTEDSCKRYCQYRRICQKNIGKLLKMAEKEF